MENITRHFRAHWLIYPGLLLYLLFFVSVARTGWFNPLFSDPALHVGAKGIDFYQVPRGAWAFWHGGSLTGTELPGGARYAANEFANNNVYHPFFTLIVGTFLIFFNPETAPYAWLWLKLGVSLLVVAYFFWTFRQHKYVSFAVLVMFVNFSIYLELAAWQFQFVLNMLLLLLLINLCKKGARPWTGLMYGLGLLVKPIGLLFLPMLVMKRRWRSALFGLGLFIVLTWLWSLGDIGKYYTDNLTLNLFSEGSLGPNQIMTLNALLHYSTHWNDLIYKAIQNSALILAVLLGLFRRTHVSKALFWLVVYYLCFYEQVYEYQWSTLPYVLAVCVVCCPEFQTRLARFFILLTCLPGCFALLNLWHIDITNAGYLGLLPGPAAWQWMVVSKLIPLFLLCASVLAGDIKPLFNQTKAFWSALRKINAHLEIFGEAEDELPEIQLSPLITNAELVQEAVD